MTVDAASLRVRFAEEGQSDVVRAIDDVGDRVDHFAESSEHSAGRFAGAWSIAAGTVGAELATLATGKGFDIGRGLFDAASDLNETLSKSMQVFGETIAGQVGDWAQDAAGKLGLSRQAAIETTASFGNLFEGIGFTQGAAADMGETTVQLAADLASFNNLEVDDVLQDLQSGLVGEEEPLRKYGVLLNEATVQQRAMAMTGKTSAQQLTEQEKAAARYQLILEQTTTAQGDFARTADGAANAGRTFHANIEDLEATIGKKLLPLGTDLLSWANGLFATFDELTANGVSPFNAMLGVLKETIRDLFGAGIGGDLWFMLTMIGNGIGSVVEIGTKAASFLADFGRGLAQAFDAGKSVSQLFTDLPAPLQGTARAFGTIADSVGDLVRGFRAGGFDELFDRLGDEARQIAGAGIDLGRIAVKGLLSLGDGILGGAKDLWGWFTDHVGLKEALTAVGIGILLGPIAAVGYLDLGDRLKEWAGNLWGWVKKELGVGPVGDGTDMSGGSTITLGDVALSATLKLAGELLAASQGFGAWLLP
ncbi:MAG TPA: hypothetical protein VH482_02810, partial [Thermomicrobiales bacterium]